MDLAEKNSYKKVLEILIFSHFLIIIIVEGLRRALAAHAAEGGTTHPLSREHFSLKIDVRDQTIWNCILEL